MSRSQYFIAKKCFVDRTDPRSYVSLQSHAPILEKLKEFYKKPFKLLVLYGEPGVGKTLLIRRFLHETKDKSLFAFFQPPLTIEGFQKELASHLFKEEVDLIDAAKHRKKRFTILIDEAQLLSRETLEFIRLLSDTHHYRFILAVHHLDPNELLSTAHFQTRIFTKLKLEPIEESELKTYIHQKLFQNGVTELAQHFHKEDFKLIHSFTHGNLRLTNKMLFTLFDMMHYFEQTRPDLLQRHTIHHFLEMSAIELGYIDA